MIPLIFPEGPFHDSSALPFKPSGSRTFKNTISNVEAKNRLPSGRLMINLAMVASDHRQKHI
jgi:hypothetical protein